MRRGQAAIEYLIILAVVVIIALIVIGVIGGFPGMTRAVSERDSAAYWSAADVGITRYYVSATTNATQLVIRNNRLFQINVTGIKLNGGSNVMTNTSVLLMPGSSANVNLTGAGSTVGCATAGGGNAFSNSMVITYTDPTYGATYTFTGEMPLVGICQT